MSRGLRWAALSFTGSLAITGSLAFAASLGCTEAEPGTPARAGATNVDSARARSGETSQTLPLAPDRASIGDADAKAPSDDALESEAASFATFTDPATGFVTDEVYDADREILRFDAQAGALIAGESGDAVNGWSVTGVELSWSRSGVPFRVRFGTEGSARRAYFTEAGSGTICNLSITGPDALSISPTSETPPNP